jgi:exonuclease SbcD
MRIIHAADLHLGRSLHERDLSADQAVMLDALLLALKDAKPALLLIAGDIYDRAIPQPEAMALFDSFLTRSAEASPGLTVVAIPGNHDSAARLSFGAGLLSRAGLHIRSRPEDAARPVIVEGDGERTAVWALPYLNPGAFSTAAEEGLSSLSTRAAAEAQGPAPRNALQGELFSGAEASGQGAAPAPRGQAELFAEAMRRITPRLDRNSYNVLLAHCFAAGGGASESERGFVGGAEEVPLSSFDAFDYVALGHLHRRQAAGPRARYPGSPLAYSFAEGEASPEKGFLLIELSPGGFGETFLPVTPLHRVRRVSGSFAELCAAGAFPEFRGDYVEARLSDPLPVLDPADPLRANFPNLLSVRQAAFELAPQTADSAEPRGDSQGAGAVLEDFRAFHSQMYGAVPDAATEALFAELLEEASHEAD